MRQFIRNKTFETNSSSMHSLVVVKNPKPYKSNELLSEHVYDNEFDLFEWEKGYYGRSPYKVLRTPIDKLRYYVAHYLGANKQLELLPEVLKFIEEEASVVKSKIKLTVEEDAHEDQFANYGYAGINDTGEDVFEYIERNNISLKEFVTNPKYVVIIDGDEYQEFKKLFESNILNAEDFEYISSGADFWNDSIYEISLHWLEYPEDNDYSLFTDGLSSINKFVKEVRLNVYEDNIKFYNKHKEELKMFIDEVKRRFPDIIFSISCSKDIYDKVKALDISIFNYLKVKEKIYSDIIGEEYLIYGDNLILDFNHINKNSAKIFEDIIKNRDSFEETVDYAFCIKPPQMVAIEEHCNHVILGLVNYARKLGEIILIYTNPSLQAIVFEHPSFRSEYEEVSEKIFKVGYLEDKPFYISPQIKDGFGYILLSNGKIFKFKMC